MTVALALPFKVFPVPLGGSLLPEKNFAHVIVDADYQHPLGGEKPRRLRADQARRTCNDGYIQLAVSLRVRNGSSNLILF